MTENHPNTVVSVRNRRFGCLQVSALLIIAVTIAVLVTVWVMRTHIFPSEFKPVTLNAKEERALEAKLYNLEVLGMETGSEYSSSAHLASKDIAIDPNAVLEPEAYSEEGARREISFTERELNALLAKNTDLARKLAVDLSDDLISAKLLLPMDEDFPVLGGKILRVKTGITFAYENDNPIVILKGVTIMGVPIPNAWLGGIKNIDLVREFGADAGFWKAFSEGVAGIDVQEGHLRIKLKE